MATILLDTVLWDLVLDINGNIAVAADPYALAQDAASAIRTFLGECYWDTTVGIDWKGEVLGKKPALALLKSRLVTAAKTVAGVASAVVFISDFSNRQISGQVQVTSVTTGQVSAASFSTIAPQGV